MSPQPAGKVRYSLVLPIFNEQAVLPLLFARIDALMAQLDGPAEAIFVDDGSSDLSPFILEARVRDNPAYRAIRLTRNFGHQIAITAGMAEATGDAVIVMDADLQDPPEVVLDLIGRWKEGFDIVYARRLTREGESAFKRATASVFYKVLEKLSAVKIPRDVGDFRLIDRRALEAFLAMPEQDRFVRGMFAWLGFKQTDVAFHRPARAAGETKYPLWKMLRLAANGVLGFSDAPLKLAVWLGLAVSGFAVLYGIYAVARFLTHDVVAGWTSTVVIVAFLCGVNMLLTGIVGLYVGRIHAEVKRRPLYVVDKRLGFERAAEAEEDASRPSAMRR